MTMLIGLVMAKRLSSIALMTVLLEHYRLLEDSVEFLLIGLEKHSREGFTQKSVMIYKYRDPRLDLVAHIQEYVKRTGKIRRSLQLMVSAKLPHKVASPVLILRYLKDAILHSGQLGMGNSVRSRASTKARLGGASLGDVLKAGDWSRASTFREFYFKPDTDFLDAVLN